LAAYADSSDFSDPETVTKAVSALVGGARDLTAQTCAVGWTQVLERIEGEIFGYRALGPRVSSTLGRALRMRFEELVGRFIGTPNDAHLKSKVQMACHRWGTNRSISGFSMDVLQRAWADPFPLQHDRQRVPNLRYELDNALQIASDAAAPSTPRSDLALLHMLREEMPRALTPVQQMETLRQLILSLPEQTDESTDVGSIAQSIATWLYPEEPDRMIALFERLKGALLAAKRGEDVSPAVLDLIAVGCGASLGILRLRPTAEGHAR
jgi:hypothetical protein